MHTCIANSHCTGPASESNIMSARNVLNGVLRIILAFPRNGAKTTPRKSGCLVLKPYDQVAGLREISVRLSPFGITSSGKPSFFVRVCGAIGSSIIRDWCDRKQYYRRHTSSYLLHINKYHHAGHCIVDNAKQGCATRDSKVR